jgi:hypothetical protein
MSDTIREQIILAIENKLAEIRKDKGYKTDCGKKVFRTVKELDPDELDAVVIWPRKEEIIKEYGVDRLTMPVDIQALSIFGNTNPSIVSEKLLGDLIENIVGRKWVFNFTSGGTYQPRPGETITGATSGATGYIEIVSLSSGSWGNGTAAGTITIRRKSGTFQSENLNIGSESDVATTDGSLTYQSAEETTADDLADEIFYISGGLDEYPDGDQKAVGAEVTIHVVYPYVAGDPYSQPS